MFLMEIQEDFPPPFLLERNLPPPLPFGAEKR